MGTCRRRDRLLVEADFIRARDLAGRSLADLALAGDVTLSTHANTGIPLCVLIKVGLKSQLSDQNEVKKIVLSLLGRDLYTIQLIPLRMRGQ